MKKKRDRKTIAAHQQRIKLLTTSNHKINWREVCHLMLEKYPLRQHTTEEDSELEIFVPLGLSERKQQYRSVN